MNSTPAPFSSLLYTPFSLAISFACRVEDTGDRGVRTAPMPRYPYQAKRLSMDSNPVPSHHPNGLSSANSSVMLRARALRRNTLHAVPSYSRS